VSKGQASSGEGERGIEEKGGKKRVSSRVRERGREHRGKFRAQIEDGRGFQS